MNDEPNLNYYNSREEKGGGFYHVTSPSKKIAVFEYRIKEACEAINELVESECGCIPTDEDDKYEKLTGITAKDLLEIRKTLDNYYS